MRLGGTVCSVLFLLLTAREISIAYFGVLLGLKVRLLVMLMVVLDIYDYKKDLNITA